METNDQLRVKLVEATAKYERSEKNLKQLKELADKAMEKYGELHRKYSESQSQSKMLRDELTEAQVKLRTLENVLEPAVQEYDHLQKQYDIEKCCRSEAEQYASKLKRENRELKRKSQELFKTLNFQPIEIDLDNSVSDSPDTDRLDERDALNRKLEALEERNKELELAVEAAETFQQKFYERNEVLNGRVQELQRKLEEAEEKSSDLEEQMKKFSRVSHLVWQECVDVKESFAKESQLKLEAELFAHQMLSERDAVIRESSILIASASGDQRLSEALLAIEDLTKSLKMEQIARQKEVMELEAELRLREESCQQRAIEALENRLQLAVEESDRLYKTVEHMENQLADLEIQKRELLIKVEVYEERLKPPTPPPLPPPPAITTRFSPLRLFTRKKKTSRSQGDSSQSESVSGNKEKARDKTYEQAIKEMMERIRVGQPLKSAGKAKQTDNCQLENQGNSSALNDLQVLLSTLKSSRDKENLADGGSNVPATEPEANASPGRRCQLRRLQRSATGDQPARSADRSGELFQAFRARGKSVEELY